MRPSLEKIEFIENYILGNFDPNEHERAKNRIDGSPELTHLFETQQCIYTATKRKGLKEEIQSYASPGGPSFFQRYRLWMLCGLAVLGIGGIFAVYNSMNSVGEQEKSNLFQTHLTKNKEDVVPWIPFDVQLFSLIAEKGATMVGMDGTLIILGESALLDTEGNRVSGKVEAELIEALDYEDMVAYNLTTTSGGKALSSGGMIRICYKQNGQEIFVDPEKPMHIEIPTDDYNPEMKVWEGEVKNNQLDWKNPQEIERYLTKIDLNYLDFVPTGFDFEVDALLPYKNHTQLSNRLIDSLYYSISSSREMYSTDQEEKNSFANDCYFDIPVRKDLRNGHPIDQTKPLLKGKNSVTAKIVDPDGNPIAGMTITLRMDRYLEHEEVVTTDENGNFTFAKLYPGEVAVYASLHSADNDEVLWKYCLESSFICPKRPKNYTLEKPLVAEYSSMINFKELSVFPKTGGCFIDPLSIKTLKGSRFQNTFIATKEFETRLQAMHLLKNGSLVLETYVKNTSEPLWKCDVMASGLLSGEEKQLFESFAEQRLTSVKHDGIHQEALLSHFTEQRKAFRAENRKQLRAQHSKTSQDIRKLRQSIETVLKEPAKLAALQAQSNGRAQSKRKTNRVSSNKSTNSFRGPAYKFSWYSSSWINIDMYLKKLGSRPWITAITTNQTPEDVSVYQCIRQSKTVIGLSLGSGSFEARFPKGGEQEETFSLAILLKDNQLLFDSRSYYATSVREIELNLEPISQDEFYLKICSLAPSGSAIASGLRAEQAILKSVEITKRAQEVVKQKLNTLAGKVEEARNSISDDVVVYNRLFDALDRCSADASDNTLGL